jgi:hypothetical protein
MQSTAATVDDYLAGLPQDRRLALTALREVFRKNLDKDFEEGMLYGMIGYYVPHRVYPAGYHCDPKQPLCFAGLSSQKNHMSLHFMPVYGEGPYKQWFVDAWKKAGKKLDMGKACIRFKSAQDLPLDVIAEALQRMPAKKWIEQYEQARQTTSKRPAKKTAKAANTTKAKSPRKKAAASKRRATSRA